MKLPTPLENQVSHCKERVNQLETCFEINSLLNSELNLEKLLDTIMNVAQKVMKADASTLMLINGETRELTFEVALSEVGEQVKEMGNKQGLKIGEGIAGTVAETGRAMIIKDAYKHPKFNPAYDKQTGFQTGSVLCAPMKVKGEIVGICQVIHHRASGKIFSGKELSLFNMFCESAALAVQNARSHKALLEIQRVEKDMEFAISVQKSFLPKEVPLHDHFIFAAKTTPARVVGGDFYDFIHLDKNLLGLLIGDVSGKGVAAALHMARLMSDFRHVSRTNLEPARVLEEMNNVLFERSNSGMFTTAIYITLDLKRKVMRVANSGHPPILLRKKNMEVFQKVEAGGPPLGVLQNTSYPQEEIALESGDRVLLYTDGVIEPKDKKNNSFGIKRLTNIFKTDKNKLDNFITHLENSVNQFAGNKEQHDDLTALAFQVI